MSLYHVNKVEKYALVFTHNLIPDMNTVYVIQK